MCKQHYGDADRRFKVMVGDITQLKEPNYTRIFIANACNEWFSGKGGGINRAIHEAAGKSLEQDTKKLHSPPAEPGQVYPVPIDITSPLRTKHGVDYVCARLLSIQDLS